MLLWSPDGLLHHFPPPPSALDIQSPEGESHERGEPLMQSGKA